MKTLTVIGLVTLFASSTLSAQDDSWQRRWYWGVQGGIALDGTNNAPAVGGHWFITGKRSALSVGFDALFYSNNASTLIANSQNIVTGQTVVNFTAGRRLQLILYGIPNDNALQFYGGAGLSINQITNARPAPGVVGGELNEALNSIEELDTKAFLVVVGGGQLRIGPWAVFAEYKLFPATDSFLLTNDQHQISGGIRFSLTHANERIETER